MYVGGALRKIHLVATIAPLAIGFKQVKERCKEGSKELHKRSAMVEDAIEDLISLALEFKPGVEVTDGDLNSMVIAKSPREDLEDEGRSHHRRRRGTESPGGGGQDEDITVMPSQPTHLLSVLDRYSLCYMLSTSDKD